MVNHGKFDAGEAPLVSTVMTVGKCNTRLCGQDTSFQQEEVCKMSNDNQGAGSGLDNQIQPEISSSVFKFRFFIPISSPKLP